MDKILTWLAGIFAGNAKIMALLVSLGLVVGAGAVCVASYNTPPQQDKPVTVAAYTPPEVCAKPKNTGFVSSACHNVPDAGSTLALMGMGIATLGGLGWKFKNGVVR